MEQNQLSLAVKLDSVKAEDPHTKCGGGEEGTGGERNPPAQGGRPKTHTRSEGEEKRGRGGRGGPRPKEEDEEKGVDRKKRDWNVGEGKGIRQEKEESDEEGCCCCCCLPLLLLPLRGEWVRI